MGNQSYSNFLEVCKLAGVLTTINKPTTGLLSLPNMDNYTATAASGPPPPDFNSNLTRSRSHNFAFTSSYSSLCQSRFAAIFAATFSRQSLLSDYQIVFCWASNNLPSCFDCNRKIGMSHSRTADMQRDQDKRCIEAVFVYTFQRAVLMLFVMGMPLMAAQRGR